MSADTPGSSGSVPMSVQPAPMFVGAASPLDGKGHGPSATVVAWGGRHHERGDRMAPSGSPSPERGSSARGTSRRSMPARRPSWRRSSIRGPPARSWPRSSASPLRASLGELFARGKPDGVILATPNQLHVDGGLDRVAVGVPVIVRSRSATQALAPRAGRGGGAGRRAVLTGHHAVTHPMSRRPRDRGERTPRADRGRGRHGAVAKPDDYFDEGGGWRRQPGGGPILLNLIDEVNNLLALIGDIVRVQAVMFSATRGFRVEETAAMVLTFVNGALGTFLLSDAAASRGRGSRPRRRTSATPATTTRTATTSPGPGARCRSRPCASGRSRRAVLVVAVRDVRRGRRPQRPARQPGRPLRRRHPQ